MEGTVPLKSKKKKKVNFLIKIKITQNIEGSELVHRKPSGITRGRGVARGGVARGGVARGAQPAAGGCSVSAQGSVSISFRREPRQQTAPTWGFLAMVIQLYFLFEKLRNKWTQSNQCPRRQMHGSGPWYLPEKVHLFKGKKKA